MIAAIMLPLVGFVYLNVYGLILSILPSRLYVYIHYLVSIYIVLFLYYYLKSTAYDTFGGEIWARAVESNIPFCKDIGVLSEKSCQEKCGDGRAHVKCLNHLNVSTDGKVEILPGDVDDCGCVCFVEGFSPVGNVMYSAGERMVPPEYRGEPPRRMVETHYAKDIGVLSVYHHR